MKRQYVVWDPQPEARQVVAQAVSICADYAGQGYDLTLRQLYYQFVARDLLPNVQRSYDRLGGIVNKARLAGMMDWGYIVDRTRNLEALPHWSDPQSVVRAAARSFALDKWATQPVRCEVWVEKEALAGVVSQAADRVDVAWFSCRGYVSQSELWAAGRRLLGYIAAGQRVVVLHLGDHDPSGIDMSRDIEDRLNQYIETDWLYEQMPDVDTASRGEIHKLMDERCDGDALEVRRIALNMDQVETYNPPPNPAKLTDSRVGKYLDEYGDESWELDALEPSVLDALITEHVDGLIESEAWEVVCAEERRHVDLLEAAADRWGAVVDMLS